MESYLGLAEQSNALKDISSGTIPTKYAKFINAGLKLDAPPLKSEGIDNTRTGKKVVTGSQKVGGSCEIDVYPGGFLGYILKHVFGNPSGHTISSSVAGTCYDHIFIPGALPSNVYLCFEQNKGGDSYPYYGCRIQSLTLNAVAGQILRATFEVVGKNQGNRKSAEDPISFMAGSPLVFHQGILKIDTVETLVKEFSITINNNLQDDDLALGQRDLADIQPMDSLLVTGNIAPLAFSDTEYQKFRALTYSVLELKFTGAELPNNSGYYYEAEIDLPHLFYTGEDAEVSDKGKIPQSLPFEAENYDAGGDAEAKAQFKLRLRNEDSSY